MKDKFSFIVVFIIIVTGAYISLSQVESASLFSSQKLKASSINMNNAPLHVQKVIEELEVKYPHVDKICVYASAMILHGLASEIGDALDADRKCIHTMVINESGDKDKLDIALTAANKAD